MRAWGHRDGFTCTAETRFLNDGGSFHTSFFSRSISNSVGPLERPWPPQFVHVPLELALLLHDPCTDAFVERAREKLQTRAPDVEVARLAQGLTDAAGRSARGTQSTSLNG